MRTAQNRLALVSFLVGALSVAIAATAVYARSVHIPGSGVVLDWLARMGLVRHRSSGVATISDPGLFAVNDETALVFLAASAIALAVVAMLMALIAEFLRQPTLYLSAGYTCGALALALFKPIVGLVAMIAGIAAAIVMRHMRQQGHDT